MADPGRGLRGHADRGQRRVHRHHVREVPRRDCRRRGRGGCRPAARRRSVRPLPGDPDATQRGRADGVRRPVPLAPPTPPDHWSRRRSGPPSGAPTTGSGRTASRRRRQPHSPRPGAPPPSRGDPLALRGATRRVRPGGLTGRPARRPCRDHGRRRARLRRVRPRGHRRGSADRGAGAAAQHSTRRHPDDPHGRARHVPADHPVRDRRRRRRSHLPGRRPADTGHAAGQRRATDLRTQPGSRRSGRLHLPRQRRPGRAPPRPPSRSPSPRRLRSTGPRSPSRRRSTSRRAGRTATRSTATTPTASP